MKLNAIAEPTQYADTISSVNYQTICLFAVLRLSPLTYTNIDVTVLSVGLSHNNDDDVAKGDLPIVSNE